VCNGQLVYVGWAVVVAAAIGLAAFLAGCAGRARPCAVLLMFSLGPAVDVGPFRRHGFFFDHLPFHSPRRVLQWLMVLTSLVLELLAVCGLDLVGARLLAVRHWAAGWPRTWWWPAPFWCCTGPCDGAQRGDEDVGANRVVTVLRAAGDETGPIVGRQTSPPWLPEHLQRLRPLNQGRTDPAALQALRQTGTRQVVVNLPSHYRPASGGRSSTSWSPRGHLRLVVSDGPLALLQLTDP
jgi:hypothetical protein